MNVDIITKNDLQQFKEELLQDFKAILNQSNTPQTEEYLKSGEVRKLLKISSGTLQNLRINRTLKFKKIGGTIYYLRSDVDNLLQ